MDLTAGAGIDSVSVNSDAKVFAEKSAICRTYLAGSTVTLRAVPEANATFREWLRGMESYSSSAEFIVNRLTANLSLTAEAEYNRYTITYQEADGRPVDNAEFVSEPPSSYVYRTGAALPALQREGYTFAGWYRDLRALHL